MIGVVFVNYTDEQYIAGRQAMSLRCLKSLIKSTENNDCRIVVVDNGGKGETGLLREEFCNLLNDKKIHAYISFDGNRGLGYARNLGKTILDEECAYVKIYPPDYYVFTDNDFFYRQDWLDVAVKVYERFKCLCPVLSFYNNSSGSHIPRGIFTHSTSNAYQIGLSGSAPGGCWMMDDNATKIFEKLPTNKRCGNEDWHVIYAMQEKKKKFLVMEGLVRHVGLGYSMWLGELPTYKAHKRHIDEVSDKYGLILDADGNDVEETTKNIK